MDEDIDKLANDLIYEAQNNQMIDTNFTEAGKLMVVAATVLRMLGLREERYVNALLDVEDRVSRALKNG
jgi:hypothetical protein